jgi:hypothetical protein
MSWMDFLAGHREFSSAEALQVFSHELRSWMVLAQGLLQYFQRPLIMRPCPHHVPQALKHAAEGGIIHTNNAQPLGWAF